MAVVRVHDVESLVGVQCLDDFRWGGHYAADAERGSALGLLGAELDLRLVLRLGLHETLSTF